MSNTTVVTAKSNGEKERVVAGYKWFYVEMKR